AAGGAGGLAGCEPGAPVGWGGAGGVEAEDVALDPGPRPAGAGEENALLPVARDEVAGPRHGAPDRVVRRGEPEGDAVRPVRQGARAAGVGADAVALDEIAAGAAVG